MMMFRFVWFLALLAAGCGSKPTPKPTEGSSVVKVDTPEPEPELPDTSATQMLADKACPRVVAPYFYRVEKAGKVSHMLGTRHMSIALDKMPAVVKSTLEKAKLVVFETPPGDDSPSKITGETALSEQLGTELWDKYKQIVGNDMASNVDSAGPAVAMLAMVMLYEYQAALLDIEIEQFATSANIATGGLESSEFQDKLLSELLDLRMLKAAIKGTTRAELRREASKDIKEYCEGTDNNPGMEDHQRKQLKDAGYNDAEITLLDKKLLDDRNDAWMPKLETMFAASNVFVVVGADHLIGKRGVAAQLGTRGFTVTRVKP